jgi:23S rRNA-/tRNA-specific pseudouridylate synthase
MNRDENLRLKTDYGNKTLDERRDARICSAFVNEEPIQGDTTTNRAHLAHRSAMESESTKKYGEMMGEMKVLNPDTGRTHYLRNHEDFQ